MANFFLSSFIIEFPNVSSIFVFITPDAFFNMCKTTSWLFQGSFWGWWMLTPASHYQVYMSSMEGLAAIVDLDGEGGLDVLPALYLKSDTKLAGSGTDSNPFYIID